jgi:hypothetical protein
MDVSHIVICIDILELVDVTLGLLLQEIEAHQKVSIINTNMKYSINCFSRFAISVKQGRLCMFMIQFFKISIDVD